MNNINKFGVKQRCMEGDKLLLDLFLIDLHYGKSVNYYIYEDDFQFLGIINRKILLEKKY